MPERLINNDNAERLINNDNAERLINNDNARIHHYKGLKAYMKDNNVTNTIIYNGPYCLQYNPIEYVNNTIKNALKRTHIVINNEHDLEKFLNNYFSDKKTLILMNILKNHLVIYMCKLH
jgi:transposase